MPFDKRSREAGRITFFTAIENLKRNHSLSENELKYLYTQQVIGIDPKGRIILKSQEACTGSSKNRSKLLDLVNREIIKRKWAGGITYQKIKASCESRTPYKELLYLPRDLVTMTLPHSPLKGSIYWRKNGNRQLSLHVAPQIGLPFGVYARLILMFLTTERIRSKDRRFELKSSWRQFLRNMHLAWGGEKYLAIKDQLRRLCATTYTLQINSEESESIDNITVSDHWFQSPDCVRVSFSEAFFNMTGNSVIPLETRIVHKLKRSPLTLDLYAWLTYRTTNLPKTTFISWPKLRDQFGADYKRLRDFRSRFHRCLNIVLRQNPISPEIEIRPAGLRLSPAPPADVEWVERQIAKAVSTTRFPLII